MQTLFQITSRFAPQELIRRNDARKKKILYKEGAYARTFMQRIMRYRKRASQPGEPPSAHKDSKRGPLLRKLINFRVDESAGSVVIGPPRVGNNPQATPRVLDAGGRVPVAKLLKARTFTVGQIGPIRYLGSGRFLNIPLKSDLQASRATQLIQEENSVRSAKGTIEIKARPFTKPAFTDGGKKFRELVAKTPL